MGSSAVVVIPRTQEVLRGRPAEGKHLHQIEIQRRNIFTFGAVLLRRRARALAPPPRPPGTRVRPPTTTGRRARSAGGPPHPRRHPTGRSGRSSTVHARSEHRLDASSGTIPVP